MKKMTITISDDTYRRIQKKALKSGQTVEECSASILEDEKNSEAFQKDIASFGAFFEWIRNGDLPLMDSEEQREKLFRKYLNFIDDSTESDERGGTARML